MRGVPVKDFPSYFWEKVSVKTKDECWIWNGGKDRNGYGRLFNYKRHGVYAMAHRTAYLLENGAIQDGMLVLHSCDNPSCVNPSHLFLGTQKDNMKDCVDKGRKSQGEKHSKIIRSVAPRGEANKKSKLTEQDVLNIRSDPRTLREISEQYGVLLNTIWRVKKRLSWSHI